MARRKIVDHNIRKLTRMGGGGRIIIKDWKKNG